MIESAIRNSSFMEARTTTEAMMLIAQHRTEFGAAIEADRREQQGLDGGPRGADGQVSAFYEALRQIQMSNARSALPEITGLTFDKTA